MRNADSTPRKTNAIPDGIAQNPVVQHSFLRGRSLLQQNDFEQVIAGYLPLWDAGFQLGPFRFCSDDATKHIAIVGAPGSGKTVLMRLLMQSTLPLIGRDWKGAVPQELSDPVANQRRLPFQQDQWDALKRRKSDLAELRKRNDLMSRHRIGSDWDWNDPVNGSYELAVILALLCGAAVLWVANASGVSWPLIIGNLVSSLVSFAVVLVVLLHFVEAKGRRLDPPKLRSTPLAVSMGGLAGLIWNQSIVFGGGLSQHLTMAVFMAVFLPLAFLSTEDYQKLLAKADKEEKEIRSMERELQQPQFEQLPPYKGPRSWDKHRALVYDAKLEVLPQLAGMGLQAPVIVMNPFDQRSVAWDMASDITEPATAKQIAAIFIPEEKNASQPFFSDAARQLLEGVMTAFILTRPKQWTLRDVLVTLKSASRLSAVLSSTPTTKDLVETFLANEKESKSIIATLATKLGPFDVVAALWESAGTKVSLREWLDSESILVLGNDEAYRSSLDIINQVIFKRVVELLLARPETSLGRTWFFLDEVKEAGNLDALGRLMTKGRSVGASVVLGFQDVDGLHEAFGEKPAKSILGQCATKVFLRLDSPETAKWAESVFGEFEAVEVKQSASSGESKSEGSSTTRGSSSTDSTSRGKTSSWAGLNGSSSKTSGTSESFSTSESSGQSSTTGQNRSVSQAADIAKRSLILASQLQNLPMTTVTTGVNGFIAHHLGAAGFKLLGFEGQLSKPDLACPRVIYRDGVEQFLRLWTPEEEAVVIPSTSATQAGTVSAGTKLQEAQRKYRKGRFLPETDTESGLRRRDIQQ